MSGVEDDLALKVVHTADWHLGRDFPSFEGDNLYKLTRARMDAVVRILGVANQVGADALLCAGDLFDEPEPSQKWWFGLAQHLATHGRSSCPVFLLPGNHDPLRPGSVYSPDHPFRKELPPWVHVVDRDDFSFELGEGAVLHAVPCRSQAGQGDLTTKLPSREPGDERIRIALLHGRTVELPGQQTNFPIRPAAAAELGFDYLALGDTHAFEEVLSQPCPVIYPGPPEPARFDEQKAGSVAVVLFRKRPLPPKVRQESVGHYRWRESTVRTIADLRTLRLQPDLNRTVLRVILDLSVTLEEDEELRTIIDELKGTEVASGRAAMTVLETRRLELQTQGIEELATTLPPVLQAAVKRLRAVEAGADPTESGRAKQALRHLYRLVKELRP